MNTHHTSNVMTRAVLGSNKASSEGRAIAIAQRQQDDGPMNVTQAANARRDAEYLARRNGLKKPLLQLWKVS